MSTLLPTIAADLEYALTTNMKYWCSVEIIGKTPDDDELDDIRDIIIEYGDFDGSCSDSGDSAIVDETITIVDQLSEPPRFRATWVDGEFIVEECASGRQIND